VPRGSLVQFLRTLAKAAASTATAGSDVTTSSFETGALCELNIALVKGNETVNTEALHVCMPMLAVQGHATVDPE
jgi:hypothetical protein